MLVNYAKEENLFEEVSDGNTLRYQPKSIKEVGIKGWLVTKVCDNMNIKLFWENEENCRNATLPVLKETEKAYAVIAVIGCTRNADNQYGLVWVPKSQCFDKTDLVELKKANEAITREIAWEAKHS